MEKYSLKDWLPLWGIVALVVLAVGTVWVRLTIVRTTYAINQADLLIRNLEQTKEQMELKVTALRSPRRLESLAKTKFGLSQPNASQVIRLHDKSIDLSSL